MRRHPLHREFFLWLLPLFFVLHGFVENYPAVPVGGALLLLLKYIVGIAVVTAVVYFLYRRNFRKASLFVFIAAFFYFFFGPFQDLLNKFLPGTLFTRYVFLLPLIVSFYVIAFVFFRKNQFAWYKPVRFVNTALLLLIVVEGLMLTGKVLNECSEKKKVAQNFTACDTCATPDIFLVIADEYAGHKPLLDNFQFDNSTFENELTRRGFHVIPNTHSNYNFTVYSMASLFNMKYLQGVNNIATDKQSLNIAYNTINDNATVDLLKSRGYILKNFSYFGFAGKPALTTQSLLVNKEGLISSQTLYSRLMRDLGYHLVTNLHIGPIVKWLTYVDLRNNELLLKKLDEELEQDRDQPRFVYTHLMLPHYPYFKNSRGELNPIDSVKEGTQGKMLLYLEYLKYANTVYLPVIDKILKQSKKPPVILFMSDHGFREYPDGVDRAYQFMNINAVFGVPDTLYKEGAANVNQMRVLFNHLFRQQFPPLKDSTIFQEKF